MGAVTTTPLPDTPASPQNDVVVLVSGSGTLLQAILDHQDETYRVVKVIADQDCPALGRAEAAGIATQVVALADDRDAWNVELAGAVAAAEPDLVVSAGFMKILGTEFLRHYAGRTINTHPALLPSFPGAHAVRDALAHGVKVTGSSIHFVDAGVDTGEIIAQEPVRIHAGDTEDSLHERIKQVERRLIVTVLRSARTDHTTGKVQFANE